MASQRSGLEVELAGDTYSLLAHTPHGCGGRITVSDEQVLDDLGTYGSLQSHSLHFSRESIS